jgi:hypothetical protein
VTSRLAVALLACALAACSAPSAQTCTQTSDCSAGAVCNEGVCQHAVTVSISSGPAALTNATTATFVFSSPDAGASFECRRDLDATFSACTSPAYYTGLPDGNRTFLVRGRLGANVAAPVSYAWTIDTTGPLVSLTTYPSDPQSQDPSFTFSSPETSAVFECKLDGGVYAACTSPKGYTGLSIGTHTFTVRAKDTLGNPSATPATYGWTQAPETTITWAPFAWTNRTTEKVAFTSPAAGATFECQLDGAAYAACTSPKSLAVANGAHTVNVRALAAGVYDPTPATTTFSVSSGNALLNYNFEGTSGYNQGQLAGYTATFSGAATTTNGYSHGATGLQAATFTAIDGSPPTNRGAVTLTGARTVLSHDFDPTDAKYTIAFWYKENSPGNVMSGTPFLPTIFHTRGTSGGFETYHGVTATQPPPWTTCWSSTPAATGCFTVPMTGSTHRWVMEYAYNGSTTGYDMRLYIDAVLVGSTSTGAGQTIFNSGQYDPVVGTDWWGYVDDLKIFNTTYAGSPP